MYIGVEGFFSGKRSRIVLIICVFRCIYIYYIKKNALDLHVNCAYPSNTRDKMVSLVCLSGSKYLEISVDTASISEMNSKLLLTLIYSAGRM